MSEKKKKNPFDGIVIYFKEVRSELKKVIWPTFKQIQNNTVIVIICLLFVGAIIWVLDLGFGKTLGAVVDLADKTKQTESIDNGTAAPNAVGDQGANQGADLTPEQMQALQQQAQQQQADGGNGSTAPQQTNE